jgi:hypothetical protein
MTACSKWRTKEELKRRSTGDIRSRIASTSFLVSQHSLHAFTAMFTILEAHCPQLTRIWISLVNILTLLSPSTAFQHHPYLLWPDVYLGNYTQLMGFGDNHNLTEYLRLYIALHGDHEGGNASAHAARTPILIWRLRDFYFISIFRFGWIYTL